MTPSLFDAPPVVEPEVKNMPEGGILIGKYWLYRTDETVIKYGGGNLSIVIHNDGEGGSFNATKFEKMIERFYAEEF